MRYWSKKTLALLPEITDNTCMLNETGKKMKNAKKIIMVLDTETADLTGAVYDVGYTITTKAGTILVERNWLVEEIFTDAKRMMGAFYAGKIFTHYARMLQNGDIALTSWNTIIAEIAADCINYNVNVIAAYNLAFDRRVMASTHAMLGGTGKILPYAMDQLDLWRFACETKLSQQTYRNLALDLGWVSAAGNIKTGAEYAYRFCAGNWGFIEDHTALSDAIIETHIMAECFKTKKTIPYNKVGGQPWRIVNS